MRETIRCNQMQSPVQSDAIRRTQMHSDALRCTQTQSDAPDALPRPFRAACAASRARTGRVRAPSRAARWPRAGVNGREGHRARGLRPERSTRRRASRVSPSGAMRPQPQPWSRRWRWRRRQTPSLPSPPPTPLPAYQRMGGYESPNTTRRTAYQRMGGYESPKTTPLPAYQRMGGYESRVHWQV